MVGRMPFPLHYSEGRQSRTKDYTALLNTLRRDENTTIRAVPNFCSVEPRCARRSLPIPASALLAPTALSVTVLASAWLVPPVSYREFRRCHCLPSEASSLPTLARTYPGGKRPDWPAAQSMSRPLRDPVKAAQLEPAVLSYSSAVPS
jgi:hypothetical protein